jgi:hypothetical protein
VKTVRIFGLNWFSSWVCSRELIVLSIVLEVGRMISMKIGVSLSVKLEGFFFRHSFADLVWNKTFESMKVPNLLHFCNSA